MKLLSEMDNEELWRLFPVILSKYDESWAEYYETEKELIVQSIGIDIIVRINHIGSTAVPNLIAKPTIDILVEICHNTDLKFLKDRLDEAGYIFSEQPGKPAPHMMFMKGYTPQGFADKIFHLHVRYFGDWDELYFRDYLISHPDTAEKYGKLKLRLKEKYKHDRDGYTQAKSDFINKVVAKGRDELK